MSLVDPVEPPEPGESRMKAADLKNQPLLIRPKRHDIVPGKDGKPWEFVECEVWVLDRSGVVAHDDEVRISWWRAVAQLREQIGQFVGARPVEQEDRSVILTRLSDAAKEVAGQVIATAGQAVAPPEPDFDPNGEHSEEPF